MSGRRFHPLFILLKTISIVFIVELLVMVWIESHSINSVIGLMDILFEAVMEAMFVAPFLHYLLISPLTQYHRERDEALKALRVSEERLNYALDATNEGIWDWNIATNDVYFSPRWAEMIGYKPEEVSGVLEFWKERVHPDDLDKLLEVLTAHLEGKTEIYVTEHRVRHKQGHWVWILDQGRVVSRDEKGNPLRAVGTHTDITERKRIDQMKSEFVSMVSHELRTPLTSIHGSIGLIKGLSSANFDQRGIQLLDIAHQNSVRLIQLINDILDMDKIESGKMSFQMEEVNIADLVRDTVRNAASYASSYNTRFEFQHSSVSLSVKGDRLRLEQVMMNLLSNAAKFSNGKPVHIWIEPQERKARVHVQDKGDGIPERLREKIFQKFEQADSSDSRSKGGTGLGLPIARMIMEKHGGEIDFNSVVGEGTTFFIDIPLAASKDISHSEMNG